MGKFFPTASVLALLLAGLTAPASAHADDPGDVWAIPLEAVPRAEASSARSLAGKALSHDDHDDDAPEGTVAAASEPLETELFNVAGVSWLPDDDDVVTGVAVRVRDEGRWTEWFELGVVDTGEAEHRVASEPVIAAAGDAIQAVVETTSGKVPEDLQVNLVRAGGPMKALTARPAATGDELRPAIVTRAEWGADENATRDSLRSSELKAMYVHHTAGSNTYSRDQAASIVKGIHSYHVKSNGWPDIGYQFLVDRFGTIYEGRRGSLDELIVGAQAGGYNTNTIGVSGLGNFHGTGVKPSSAMIDGIVQVLSWQAHKWDLDPTGTVRLMTGGSTGSGTRWKPGELTDPLPVILGHKDTNVTACPGDDLYARLGSIRTAVAQNVHDAVAEWGHALNPPANPTVVPLIASQAPLRLSSKVTLKWRAVPGAVKYQVVQRKAAHGKKLNTKWRSVRTTKSLRYQTSLRFGEYHEYAVRAIDAQGRRSGLSPIGSITRPIVSGKQLKRSSKDWRIVKKKKHYRGRAFRTTTAGATITLSGGRDFTEVWLVVASGRGHGRISVSVNGARVRTVGLDRSSYDAKRIIRVPLAGRRSGTVTITARDQGKQVNVTAIGLVRD